MIFIAPLTHYGLSWKPNDSVSAWFERFLSEHVQQERDGLRDFPVLAQAQQETNTREVGVASIASYFAPLIYVDDKESAL